MRQSLIWLLLLAGAVLLLVLLQAILLPFVVGIALAYLLDPLVVRIERLGLSRMLSSMLVVGLTVLIGVVLLVLVVPLIVQQVIELASLLTEDKGRVAAFMQSFGSRLADSLGIPLTQLQAGLQRMIGELRGWAVSSVIPLAQSLLSGGLALVNFVALLIVTPIVAFFLLCDWDRLIATVDSWVPRDRVDQVRAIAAEMNDVLAGFVRGQLTVCVILGSIYAAGLWLVGLDYAILIGLGSGLLCFIPFAGTWAGFLLALAVALSQFWPDDNLRILLVGAVYLVGQILEGNVLSPNIVGRHVRLHPVWMIFAFFAMAYLFGFVGVLIAVPFAAAVGVLGRFAVREYLKSELYLGSASRKAGGSGGEERP